MILGISLLGQCCQPVGQINTKTVAKEVLAQSACEENLPTICVAATATAGAGADVVGVVYCCDWRAASATVAVPVVLVQLCSCLQSIETGTENRKNHNTK